MSEQAGKLAGTLEAATADFRRLVEGLSDAQLDKLVSGENWPARVVASHIAGGYQGITGFVQALAAGGQLPPITPEQLDQMNAETAKQFAGNGKQDILALLDGGAPAAVNFVRGLSDTQLANTSAFMGGTVSTQQVIENILIGHVVSHMESLKTVL